jgi:hypothetical protein
MSICERPITLSTFSYELSVKVFETLPDDGFAIAFLDFGGNLQCSDPSLFSEVFTDQDRLSQLITRLNDGDELLVTQFGKTSIVATELTAGPESCGYIFLAIPNGTPESTIKKMDLIECVINQISQLGNIVAAQYQDAVCV